MQRIHLTFKRAASNDHFIRHSSVHRRSRRTRHTHMHDISPTAWLLACIVPARIIMHGTLHLLETYRAARDGKKPGRTNCVKCARKTCARVSITQQPSKSRPAAPNTSQIDHDVDARHDDDDGERKNYEAILKWSAAAVARAPLIDEQARGTIDTHTHTHTTMLSLRRQPAAGKTMARHCVMHVARRSCICRVRFGSTCNSNNDYSVGWRRAPVTFVDVVYSFVPVARTPVTSQECDDRKVNRLGR